MKYKVIGAISALLVVFFFISCQSETTLEFKRYYSLGAEVYKTRCQNCHGSNGEGLAALVPPLTDSLYLKNNKTLLACYIRLGLKGPITVNGKVFDDNMPANDIAPMEMAQVLTYINNSFGNKLGVVTIDQAEAAMEKCK